MPKIADFGLSTVDVNEMKGMGVGTGRWRAPEVFKNKPKNCQDKFKGFYTSSSDVYSFGVIVWVRSCVCGECGECGECGVCGVARAVWRVRYADARVWCARRSCFTWARCRGRASWTPT